jgi:hypothetical protein
LFAARPDAAHAETLAMAAAATGDYAQAVDLGEQLVAAAVAAGDEQAAIWRRGLLGRFRAGQPADRAWPAAHEVFRPAAEGAGPRPARDR